jgi:hypothetical protein
MKIIIKRKGQTDKGHLYDIVRQYRDGTLRHISNQHGALLDIAGVYHLLDENGHSEDSVPIEFGEGVMHDYAAYAEMHEQKEREEIRKRSSESARMAAG